MAQETTGGMYPLGDLRDRDRLDRWLLVGAAIGLLIAMIFMSFMLAHMNGRLEESQKVEKNLSETLANISASEAEQREFRLLIERFLAANTQEQREEVLEELREERRLREEENGSQSSGSEAGIGFGSSSNGSREGSNGSEDSSSTTTTSTTTTSTTTSTTSTTTTTTTQPPLACVVGECIDPTFPARRSSWSLFQHWRYWR